MASISQAISQPCLNCSTGGFSESMVIAIRHSFKTPSAKFSGVTPQSSTQLFTAAASSSKWQQYRVISNHLQSRQSLQASSSSSSPVVFNDSPFTEKYSPRKSQGKGLVPNSVFLDEREALENTTKSSLGSPLQAQTVNEGNSSQFRNFSSEGGADQGDLSDPSDNSAQLPELREVLTMLRQRWEKEAASGKRRGPGNVFLVGTGPGDPELLTVKALRLMQSADLVLYDRLVSTDILDFVHPSARLLYVGKTSGFHSRTQEEIHELLLNFAEAGATVVRLKGGDPLVFGRGGEEMDFLQDQGIQVKVVPGITAASGIAAELGIPLTHRGAANSVRFLTGHSRKGGDDPLYVAEQAADPDSTLVIYMGLATLPGLAAKLMAHGLPPDTPAAAVERGTTPQQRLVFATLATLPEEVNRVELVSPTLIFIGRVVSLSPLWPSDLVSIGSAAVQKHPSREIVSSSPSVLAGNSFNEPRNRQRRGPDPSLPSQQ
ncbi:unnamed protein product [Calypogeia fissa]